jgi:hypothetical protein
MLNIAGMSDHGADHDQFDLFEDERGEGVGLTKESSFRQNIPSGWDYPAKISFSKLPTYNNNHSTATKMG